MSIQARFDVGTPGPHYFQRIPIYEDRGWKMIFEKTSQVVELYIKCEDTDLAERRIGQDEDNQHESDGALKNSSDEEHPKPRRQQQMRVSLDVYKNQLIDNPLAEGKTFDSKEHLQIAIAQCTYDWLHVETLCNTHDRLTLGYKEMSLYSHFSSTD
uniref:Uncharacterized protein n=1 Tax=Leersia perrieri TaxID=77586 RepID=A0A0D9W324_9ORYZ